MTNTCEEMFEDGPCGQPATRTIVMPNEKLGLAHFACDECAEYHIENSGAVDQQPPAEEPIKADAVKPVKADAVKPANHTPEEHSSLVGGSTASRRINCPRSYALEKLAPPDKGSSYAREGTALHEMIAIVIGEGKKPENLLPFTFSRDTKGAEEAWSLTIDEDLWYDLGQPALDAFDDFCDQIEAEAGEEIEIQVEERCAMPGIDGAFGTTDVAWKCGHLSGIWDWKFGRTPVSADSDQLRFYARAVAADHPNLFGAKSWGDIDMDREVILSIMQPQCGSEPSEHRTTVGELEEFRLELMGAIADAVEKGDKAHVAKGDWCKFATCRSVCPLHVGQSLEFGEKMAKLSALQKQQGVKDLRAITAVDKETGEASPVFAEMLPELLELAEIAKEFAGVVMAQAHAYLEEGGTAAGWALKMKRSSGREWVVDDDAVRKFMKNRKYTLDQFAPRKTMTMPQIETLLKRDGRAIPEEMYAAKPSSGTTLTRDDGSSRIVGSTSERLKTAGTKLAALRDE